MPIDWHKGRLKNWTASVNRNEEDAKKILESVLRNRQEIAHLAAQIERAEREGRDGFDSDRFTVKTQRS